MREVPVPPVSSSWQRIDAWLAAYAPASLVRLNPPVTTDALELVQRVVGIPLPAELVESLACHDGLSGQFGLLPEGPPLSAGGTADIWEESMEIVEGREDAHDSPTLPEGKEPGWHPLWIPWADRNGVAQVIDLRPGDGYGRLGIADLKGDGDFSDPWPNLTVYLHEVAQALYSGSGVRGVYPFLTTRGGLLWAISDGGYPLIPAPVGVR